MPTSTSELSRPSGSRRLTLTMLSVRDQADAFKGAPAGSVSTFRYLAAFQEAEPFWTRIGAAWPHDNGPGFTIQLDAIPVDGRIVLTEPKAE